MRFECNSIGLQVLQGISRMGFWCKIGFRLGHQAERRRLKRLSPAGFFYRPPSSSVSLFGAAIFWTSLNPAALRRDEQAFDDR